MAHQEREWTVNEPDEPNITAVYVIIVLSLVGLAITMWGLAEYKGHIDKKRQERIQSVGIEESRKKIEEKDAPGMKVIEQIIEEKSAK